MGNLSITKPFYTPFLNCPPVILQGERNDCAFACLCMIAHYHGKNISLSTLRHKYGSTTRGTTLRQLITIAEAEQLSAKAFRLNVDELSQMTLPCVLHWQHNHFVVLTKASPRVFTIHDPAIGKRDLTFEEFVTCFSGIAVTFTPSCDFAIAPSSPRLKLQHLWGKSEGLWPSLLGLLVLSLLIQALALTSPYYTQLVVDEVLTHHQQDLLLVVAGAFFLLVVTETAISVLRRTVLLRFSSLLSVQLSQNLFSHLLSLPIRYFEKREVGDLLSRFRSLDAVRDVFTTGSITMVLDGLTAILLLLVMGYYSPTLTLIVMFASVASLVCRLISLPVQQQLLDQQLQAEAAEQSNFIETIRAIQTIKRLQLEHLRFHQWQQRLGIATNFRIRYGKWDIGILSFQQLVVGSEYILLVYVAASMALENVLTVGMMFAFLSYRTHFSRSLENLFSSGYQFRLLRVHLQRLAEIAQEPRETSSLPVCELETRPTSLDLSCKNMSYKHGMFEPWVFNRVCFFARAGSCVAIIGPSGAGKTTLLKCLMGLLPLNEGTLMYGERVIKHANQLNVVCASVMQDDDCLSGTIAENISAFSENPDPERIHWAAKQACILEDIMRMPMQFSSWVADMGRNMSGGQRQRILLARALYCQPSLLFLDEATSHLDIYTEQRISFNLAQLKITRIFIAHRPETIAIADHIYMLSNGTLTTVDKNQWLEINHNHSGEM